MTQPVLELSKVAVGYGRRTVLSNVTFSVYPAEFVVLIGRSGSGKSTLLNAILGLVQHKGMIAVCGRTLTRRTRTVLRREKMGAVFQDHQLIDELSPVENVAISAMIQGAHKGQALGDAEEILGRLAVPHDRATAAELSGGEKQRTALARALVKKPSLLLADEPTGSLDLATRDESLALMVDASREFGCSLVVVTHDMGITARADRVHSLDDGSMSTVRIA